MSRRGAGGGFTLIELLIVVAIVAILAAIAIPSYRAYIVRSNRTAAKGCLSQLANYMERYYATNLRYDQDTSTPPVKLTTASLPTIDCMTQQTNVYTFDFAPGGGSFSGVNSATVTAPAPNPAQTAYVLEAKPQGTQQTGDTQCQTLALDQTGAQAISGAAGNVQTCWER
jgi:type IV pilus assembly protein PilE